MEQFKLVVDLPQEVLDRIRTVVSDTIQRELTKHIKAIHAKPLLLTRLEAAQKLRVSLPTLKSYEDKGYLSGQRIGRRVLFQEDQIESYLASSNHS
jgi:excisionase family DNA binding protein